jgi:hypothetical protein
MSKTDLAEADILRLFTGQATTTFTTTPITPYIALFTVAPSETGGGTEQSGSAYARILGAFSAPSGTAPTACVNSGAVLFPVVTGSGYTLLGAALMTLVTAGSMLRWSAISSLALGVGDQANFAAGAISFTED